MEVIKVNDNTVRVITTTTKEQTYPYEVLIMERLAVQKKKDEEVTQKNTVIAQLDKELAELDNIIAECHKLGITGLTPWLSV